MLDPRDTAQIRGAHEIAQGRRVGRAQFCLPAWEWQHQDPPHFPGAVHDLAHLFLFLRRDIWSECDPVHNGLARRGIHRTAIGPYTVGIFAGVCSGPTAPPQGWEQPQAWDSAQSPVMAADGLVAGATSGTGVD
jgi:hypothetical protein